MYSDVAAHYTAGSAFKTMLIVTHANADAPIKQHAAAHVSSGLHLHFIMIPLAWSAGHPGEEPMAFCSFEGGWTWRISDGWMTALS